MILTIGGIKGGNGKSTIATNLAVMRSCESKDILLVDADEQKSSTIFAAIRRQEHPDRPQFTGFVRDTCSWSK
jgi:chromosome partitioning protein